METEDQFLLRFFSDCVFSGIFLVGVWIFLSVDKKIFSKIPWSLQMGIKKRIRFNSSGVEGVTGFGKIRAQNAFNFEVTVMHIINNYYHYHSYHNVVATTINSIILNYQSLLLNTSILNRRHS